VHTPPHQVIIEMGFQAGTTIFPISASQVAKITGQATSTQLVSVFLSHGLTMYLKLASLIVKISMLDSVFFFFPEGDKSLLCFLQHQIGYKMGERGWFGGTRAPVNFILVIRGHQARGGVGWGMGFKAEALGDG
jgi:hypothetical protein